MAFLVNGQLISPAGDMILLLRRFISATADVEVVSLLQPAAHPTIACRKVAREIFRREKAVEDVKFAFLTPMPVGKSPVERKASGCCFYDGLRVWNLSAWMLLV